MMRIVFVACLALGAITGSAQAMPLAPLTGGNGDELAGAAELLPGSGAGNAPWA